MNAPATLTQFQPAATVEIQLDGRSVTAFEGETILTTAKREGIEIPHLCFKEGYRPDGNCRACMVEVKGERVLAPSCCRSVSKGMEVTTDSPRARKSQKMVLEMLLADLPEQGFKWVDGDAARPHGELSEWAQQAGVTVRPELRALQRAPVAPDLSHPAMAVNLDACIQCTRCVRACREEQVNDVIGYAMRGAHSEIIFDLGDKMGDSTCVACGECVQACPTGALMPKTAIGTQVVDKKIDSVCPFCGVGCLLTYNVRDNAIVSVDGRDGPANHSRLCVKGRFGFDYASHPQRLTKPLIRKAGAPKDDKATPNPADWSEVFREATWAEALDFSAGRLRGLRDTYGPKSLAGFGSAKGSNEEIPANKIPSGFLANQFNQFHAVRVFGNGLKNLVRNIFIVDEHHRDRLARSRF